MSEAQSPKWPTCKTCVYFAPFKPQPKKGTPAGKCRRRAPRQIDRGPDYGDNWNDFADVYVTDWCGEHPDFHAWLAQQRPSADTEIDPSEAGFVQRFAAEANRQRDAARAEAVRLRKALNKRQVAIERVMTIVEAEDWSTLNTDALRIARAVEAVAHDFVYTGDNADAAAAGPKPEAPDA